MKALSHLIVRNIKMFFRDKGMFFTSLITPAILLVLYSTFLGNVYEDTFVSMMQGVSIPDKLLRGLTGGQLVSSILSVSCVTVAFCSNFLMVQDKTNGSIDDLKITPVSTSVLSLGYYIASFLSTLIICLFASAICFAYLGVVGWYLAPLDAVMFFVDVLLLVMLGTAVSSVVNFFLSTQGQISAVGAIVSSCYGFVCGAYMPLSQLSDWLRNSAAFLPGTYGTSLLRTHAMSGAIAELGTIGVPEEVLDAIKQTVDCELRFFDIDVSYVCKYAFLGAAVVIFMAVYVAMNIFRKGRRS